jgi:hypothetical protein
MKAYTDLEQSKKLAEILPLESADMTWCNNSIKGINYTDKFSANLYTVKEMKDVFDEALVGWDKYWELVPCWSLSALLDILPDEVGDNHYLTLDKEGKEYCCCYEDNNGNSFRHCFSDNPVDACYKMVLKLHEQKLL